ncbi:MAG: hypothetical protein KDA87_09275 [Planctomycetales bacterium]|nr:hypothetical protein [Planctomycetales bacterium]
MKKFAFIIVAIMGASSVMAEDFLDGDYHYNPRVVKVEETWSLEVGAPNPEANAPQITMAMSPTGGLLEDYFIFTVNMRPEPSFEPGGLQVQRWYGDEKIQEKDGPVTDEMATWGETVSWKQVMSVDNGQLTFEIRDGSSETWGSFGGQGYLKIQIAQGYNSLNDYDPRTSITQSGIGFSGNRVASLTLQQIRWTLNNGQVYVLNAPIDIDSDLDPWTDGEDGVTNSDTSTTSADLE